LVCTVSWAKSYERAIRAWAMRRNTRLCARFQESPGDLTVTLLAADPDG